MFPELRSPIPANAPTRSLSRSLSRKGREVKITKRSGKHPNPALTGAGISIVYCLITLGDISLGDWLFDVPVPAYDIMPYD